MQGIIPDILQRMKSGSHLIISAWVYQEQYETSVISAQVYQGDKNISHLGTDVSKGRDTSNLGIGVSKRQDISHLGKDVSKKLFISHLGTDESGESHGKENRRTGGLKT